MGRPGYLLCDPVCPSSYLTKLPIFSCSVLLFMVCDLIPVVERRQLRLAKTGTNIFCDSVTLAHHRDLVTTPFGGK